MPWLIPCRDDLHAASEAARTLLDAFVAAGEHDFALALSGGRIASTLFDELVRQSRTRRTPLANADIFWADERCVDPAHPDSNHHLAHTHLLQPLGSSAHNIHRLPGELPPAEGARRANADWDAWALRRGPARAHLDGILLGVGEDGHVASLFPDNLALDLTARTPFSAVTGPKPPPDRLTLGYRWILEARRVVILATGTGKESILARCLGGDTTLPLGRILAGRPSTTTLLISPLIPGRARHA